MGISKEIYVCGNGFPSYRQSVEFFKVSDSEDLREHSIMLLASQLDQFSDQEIFQGVIAEVFVCDEVNFKSFQIITDGL